MGSNNNNSNISFDTLHILSKVIGPGALFAGSAVGISHLVQSSRAGAVYGFGLIGFIFLSMVAKYPAFRFGPAYSVATGRSILSDYQRQGKHSLIFFGIYTMLFMFIALSSNLIVTTGLVQAMLGFEEGTLLIAATISVGGIVLLTLGQYHWLDMIMKTLIIFLFIATVAATIASMPMIMWSNISVVPPNILKPATIMFIAALIGFMPAPLDVSIWHSQWMVAKMRDTDYIPTERENRFDFNMGYITTLLLAICFVTVGTAVMYGSNKEFSSKPVGFTSQIIDLYKYSLGSWSANAVNVAAIVVMFSTTLTILDGFPRSLANLTLLLKGKEETVDEEDITKASRQRYYFIYLIIMTVVGLAILSVFPENLPRMVDFAATVSFIAAPLFAFFNHKAIFGKLIPLEKRPGLVLYWWSIAGINILVSFALIFVYLAFFN